MTGRGLRSTIYDVLENPESQGKTGRIVDVALIALISVNIFSVIIESVDWIYQSYAVYFELIELVSVAVFSVEYALRLWVCLENEALRDARFPRLNHAVSPLALIDLVAILPFYLTFFFAIDLRFLRVLRLLRIFKLTRYSSAMTMLLDVFREEANAFFAGFFILIVLLVLVASGAYLVEHDTQPDKFGSIPSAMWWAMATLTTVGYGDVTPVTPFGKLFGACVTVIGIGMAALPAGILASGLADHLRRRRELLSEQFRRALEDGTIDEHEEEALEALRKELGLSVRATMDIRDDIQRRRDAKQQLRCPHCDGIFDQPGRIRSS
ncbi:MAG: ion transporter [Alphaproteobacteria bacterium]|nr:ion transporter [Alphaproteobacteria bacterium]